VRNKFLYLFICHLPQMTMGDGEEEDDPSTVAFHSDKYNDWVMS